MSSSWSGNLKSLSAALVALTTVSVGLRFYARRKMRVRLWADDWVMAVAFLAFLGIAGGMFEWITTSFTDGAPDSQDGKPSVSPSILLAVLTLLSIFCLGCTKASACLLYRRIFDVRVYERTVIGTLINLSVVVVALWTVAFLIVFGTTCDGHLTELLNPSIRRHSCDRAWSGLLAISISDVVLDVWVLALPMIPVFRLHASLARKLSIAGVFLLGAVALAASIARLVISTEFLNRGFGRFTPVGVQDELSKCFFFLTFESGISIIAINLPIIGPLVMHSDYGALAKAARSVRSLFSTGSGTSKNSSGTSQEKVPASRAYPGSNYPWPSDSSSSSDLCEEGQVHDLEEVPRGKVQSSDGIYVESTVEIWSKRRDSDDGQSLSHSRSTP